MSKKTAKHILFIAYQFPPLNVGGSERPFKLVTYLPEFDVIPHVLTLDPESYINVYGEAAKDDEMLKKLPSPVELIPIPSKDLRTSRNNRLRKFSSIYFNIYRGVEYQYWSKEIYQKVATLMDDNQRKFDAIVVTAPPFGMLKIAKGLSKKYKLPLIVDMRDHWTFWNMTPYSNYLNYKFTKLQEEKVFEQASKVVGVTNEQIQDFKFLHPMIPASKFKWIPNGYDAEISENAIKYSPSETITIGYVGNFYYNPELDDAIFKPFWKKKGHRKLQYLPRKENWKYRSPYFFFKNIRYFIDQHPEFAKKITLRFAGRKPYWFDEMVSEYNLEHQVEHVGRLKKQDVFEFQRQCDFMLITSVNVINGLDYCIAGKSFEHIGLERPMLGFVKAGAQMNFLKRSGMAKIFDPDEVEANVKRLRILFTKGEIFQPNMEYLKRFHRKQIAKEMSDVIHEVCKNSNHSSS